MKRYFLGLKGESNYQPAIARLKRGSIIELSHEPTNPYDDRAIKATSRAEELSATRLVNHGFSEQ